MNESEFTVMIESTPWWDVLQDTMNGTDDENTILVLQQEMVRVVFLETCFEAPAYEV